MEHQNILNLLNKANDSNDLTRKWNIVSDRSNANSDIRNEITFNTEVLKANFCDNNDAYILVRGDITVTAAAATQVSFKNCIPFTTCITKIGGTMTDDAEDLDLIMSMYNLIEYSSNYSETTESLWFYSKDESTDFNNNIANTNDFKSFKYNAKLLGNTEVQPNPNHANGILKNTTIALPLKYLSNFCKSLEMPLINSKIELKLKWTKYFVLSANGNDKDDNNNNIFTIKDTKLHVPVATVIKTS